MRTLERIRFEEQGFEDRDETIVWEKDKQEQRERRQRRRSDQDRNEPRPRPTPPSTRYTGERGRGIACRD